MRTRTTRRIALPARRPESFYARECLLGRHHAVLRSRTSDVPARCLDCGERA